jgi:spermidine synthase
MILLVALLFACSGCAGLIFEVLWTRQFSLVLGSTVQSAALIAGTFLFLLGLGGRLGSRLSRRGKGLAVYAALEAVAALSGAIVTWLLPQTAQWTAHLGDNQLVLVVARCLLAVGLLGIPCLAMGASLPVLCSWLMERNPHLYLRNLSRLYSINTLGAVAGVLLADWVLIQRWGLFRSGLMAAGLDAFVAIVALLVGRASLPATPQQSRPERVVFSRFSREFLLLAGLGLAGALLQLVWTRSLILFQGSDLRAFSSCLATYLAGLTVGGALASWMRPAWTAHNRALTGALLGVALASLASFLLLGWSLRAPSPWMATLLTIGPGALAMGAAFPLASEALHRRWADSAEVAGWTVMINTLGSLLGSLLTGFVLLPFLGLQFSMVLSVLVAAVLAGLSASQTWGRLAAATLAAASVVLWVRYPSDYLKTVVYPQPNYRFLFWGEGNYGSVALVEESDAYLEEKRELLMVDGFNMMGSGLQGRRYATAIGALPVLLQPRPEKALVICFGLAHTVTAVLDLEDTRSVDCVELSPTVVEATSRLPRCERALQNPKMHLKIGDGRHHLLTTKERYNLVVAEPPPPQLAGVVNLYSREYYQLCRSRLQPGGMVVQWLPIFQLSQRDGRVIIRAFQDVFPNSYLVEGSFEGQLLLLGTDAPLRINYADFVARASKAQALLTATGWDSPADLLASFLAGPERLREYAGNTPPLTDDWPILQYDEDVSPDYPELVHKDFPAQIPIDFPGPAQQAEFERVREAQKAARTYLYPGGSASPLAGYQAMRRALQVEPDSRYFQQMSLCHDGFRERLRQRCEGPKPTPEAFANLARILYFRGDLTGALTRLEQSARLKSTPFLDGFRTLLYWEMGQQEQARRTFQQGSSRLDPADRKFLEALLQ